jgi:hypothetical protein
MGMLHSAAKNSKRRNKALLPHHITMARRISRTQPPKTRSLRYTSDMAWLRPSEQAKMSRCDRSSYRQAKTQTSTHGQAKSRQTHHCPPRVADMAYLCPSREALRSLVPRVDRGRHWLGCSRHPHLRCCLSTRGLGKTAAGRWLECLDRPVTTNTGMRKTTSAVLSVLRTRSLMSLTDICFEIPIRRTLRFTVRIRLDCR